MSQDTIINNYQIDRILIKLTFNDCKIQIWCININTFKLNQLKLLTIDWLNFW